jgi:nitrile hydratase
MKRQVVPERHAFPAPRLAAGEEILFKPGDQVRVLIRFPIGHYRVPRYVRGKSGVVEAVIEPRAVNNEEEGFGRNAGCKRHYYRVGFPMTELWQGYAGSGGDRLKIEVFETWLQRI